MFILFSDKFMTQKKRFIIIALPKKISFLINKQKCLKPITHPYLIAHKLCDITQQFVIISICT